MGNKTKKQEETESWNTFVKYCKDPLIHQLSMCEDVSQQNQERPDLVLKNGSTVYAIEQISIPMIRIKSGSAQRIREAQSSITYQEYMIDEKNGIDKLTGHEKEAISAIENIINRQLVAESGFSHTGYIQTCRELLVDKHNAATYRANVLKRFPHAKIYVFFLLDIAAPIIFQKGVLYKHLNSGIIEKSVRKDYPFTKPFLDVLRLIDSVDKILILWHLENRNNKNDVRCYILDPKIDWKKQGIHPIWELFELHSEFELGKRVKLVPTFPVE